MRRLQTILCGVLSVLLFCQPAAPVVTAIDPYVAADRSDTDHVEAFVTSVLRVSPAVTEESAAERLYYLGLVSGVGVRDNRVDFALDLTLTKLECLVMAVRLVGVETEVLESQYDHPFSDVPEWGASYVGYYWREGLVEDTEDHLFYPDDPVSSAMFMQYMLNALGYDLAVVNQYADAAVVGQRIGICGEVKDAVTRGDAMLMMYRTLDTAMSGKEQLLSFYLVEEGILQYQDVLFLLWNENTEEAETYIKRQGYTTLLSVREGRYTVSAIGSGRQLNVAVNGANHDYEGVGVNVWKGTDDISQKFRLEKTETGTYRLYSCASGGGYKRSLGFNKNKVAGLYSNYSPYFTEYILQCADGEEGSWYILSAADPTLAVSTPDDKNGAGVSLQPLGTEGYAQRWLFTFDSAVNEEGYEFALYPGANLCITQKYYDNYSHQKQNALDITTTKGSVFAPFTGKIVRIDRGYYRYNTVWLESCDKVVYADGTVDYMTVVLMHDNNVSNLSVGQIVAQGEYFYDMGVAGGSTGPHVHLAVYRGKGKQSSPLTGSGDVYPEKALFVSADTVVTVSYGLDWVYLKK